MERGMNSMKHSNGKKILSGVLFAAALLAILVFILFPIYWCLVTSFKPSAEITSKNVTYWPKTFTFQNYVEAWIRSGFSNYFKNSLFIAVFGVVFIVILSILTGYALARFKFKGKNVFMLILLCTQFIPGAMLITPIFIIFKNLNMLNSLFALVLVNTTFHFPFNSILMRGFISGIDYTIEEAAQIDGCSRLGAIRHVLLPILKPGIATIAAYGFISCWNEFLFALTMTDGKAMRPIAVGLAFFIDEMGVHWGPLMAASILMSVPAVIFFSLAQNQMVKGLSAGAVKG